MEGVRVWLSFCSLSETFREFDELFYMLQSAEQLLNVRESRMYLTSVAECRTSQEADDHSCERAFEGHCMCRECKDILSGKKKALVTQKRWARRKILY